MQFIVSGRTWRRRKRSAVNYRFRLYDGRFPDRKINLGVNICNVEYSIAYFLVAESHLSSGVSGHVYPAQEHPGFFWTRAASW